MEGYYDRYYYIKSFLNLRPHWRGMGKSHIYFRPRRQTWRLESFYDTNRYVKKISILCGETHKVCQVYFGGNANIPCVDMQSLVLMIPTLMITFQLGDQNG